MRRYKKPYRIEKKKSIWRKRFFWLGTLIVFLAGAGFYFFLLSETFQIEGIVVKGAKKISGEAIELIAEENMAGATLFFKAKNIFWADTEKIESEILEKFPEISRVEISRQLPDVLNISVIERSASAVWCREDDCFLIDNEGIIFEQVRVSEERGLIKIIEEQKTSPFNLGEAVIEKEKLDKVLKIERTLKTDFKIPLKEISLPTENRVNAETLEGWEIYFDLGEDLDDQLFKLRTVLKEENFSREREKLQYIDLRFEKIYYI